MVYKDNPEEKETVRIEQVETRRIFEENLKKGGVELEYENSGVKRKSTHILSGS